MRTEPAPECSTHLLQFPVHNAQRLQRAAQTAHALLGQRLQVRVLELQPVHHHAGGEDVAGQRGDGPIEVVDGQRLDGRGDQAQRGAQ